MHLLDVERGFFGGWGIVAGQLPVAVGLALALVRQGKPQAVLCELGDGAVNMGAWHESLNLAALWSLPVVFLVVNNEYGMGTSVERASAEPELYKRACAFGMHGERVDGDDYDAVAESAGRLLRRARDKREPAVLEAMTYRYRGHSVADAGLSYSTKDEIDAWKGKDPIALMRGRLVDQGVSDDELIALEREVAERVERRWPTPRLTKRRASRSWPPACMRPVAPSSSSACGRAARSVSSNSSSTAGLGR